MIFHFSLSIDYQTFLHHYHGQAQQILVWSEEGKRLSLPAARFRTFLLHNGVNGRFRLEINAQNSILSLQRC
ncbi:DUF2835 domain-containing protein [Plesiomonas shigelloides]|uniref:DUF2835 family protein n=1 Tax=Plesiomonas shigelloides TaxID=703 RepID=UPI0009078666